METTRTLTEKVKSTVEDLSVTVFLSDGVVFDTEIRGHAMNAGEVQSFVLRLNGLQDLKNLRKAITGVLVELGHIPEDQLQWFDK